MTFTTTNRCNQPFSGPISCDTVPSITSFPALFLALPWHVRSARATTVPQPSILRYALTTCGPVRWPRACHLRLTALTGRGPWHCRRTSHSVIGSGISGSLLRWWFLLLTTYLILLDLFDRVSVPTGLCWTWLMAAFLVTVTPSYN